MENGVSRNELCPIDPLSIPQDAIHSDHRPASYSSSGHDLSTQNKLAFESTYRSCLEGNDTMPRYFFTAADGLPKGPVDIAVLRSMVETGHLSTTSRVIEEGTDQWIEAKDAVGVTTISSRAMAADRGFLVSRYRDAQLVASAIVTFSMLVKLFAWLVAIVTWIAGFVISKQMRGGGEVVMVGLVFGTGLLGFFYVLGVLIAAVGQILRASLDTAVNTSPLLNETEKLQAIG